MKKHLLFLAIFSILAMSAGAQTTGGSSTQTVYTEPTFITTEWNDNGTSFYVYFDATKGNAGMVGATSCYAHTGVITTASTSSSDWKHAPTWGDNSPKYEMESVHTDLWRLEITDGIREYYGLADGEYATQLAFVFRNSDASMEGKEADGSDIFYTLYEPGLNIAITSPSDGLLISEATDITFSCETSEAAKITLMVGNSNDIQTFEVSDATSASFIVNLSEVGTYDAEFIAETATETASASVSILYEKPTVYEDMPDWMQEGINYDSERNLVGLAFRAPLNESVFVLGDFNDWTLSNDYKMNCWETTVTNPTSDPTDTPETSYVKIFWLTFQVSDPAQKYAFQYLVDGTQKIGDPYATTVLDPWNDGYITDIIDPSLPEYPSAGDGLVSVLEVVDNDPYEWEVTDFKVEDQDNLVIYELLIRDFCTDSNTGQGTLECVMEYLDYLEYLGVNAIELMPICEFDGNNSWGYNPNHYFAADKAYGTRNQYKQFIDECHKRGMAVIVDMVINHASGICPLAALYYENSATTEDNPWFNVVARHPYNVYHDFNHEYEGTRSYFKRVLQYWIEEYKVDGYRMDLAKGLTQYNSGDNTTEMAKYDATRIAIIKDYYDAVLEANENAVFILEHFTDNSEEQELADLGMMCWRNMNNNYCQAAMGWPSSSTFVDSDGEGGMFEIGWVSYAESHDEERNFSKVKDYGDGNLQEDEEARLDRVPLVIAFAHLMPGAKMLWQFGEMGYDYSINYCSDGTNSEDCRTDPKPVPWELGWDNDELRMKAYEASADIINLRTMYPEYFKAENVTVQNCATTSWNSDSPRMIRISYEDEQDSENSVEIIVVGNFSATESINPTITFPSTGTWYDHRTGETFSITRSSRQISLAPGQLRLLTNRELENPTPIEETEADEAANISVYPSPTDGMVYVDTAEEVQNIYVFDYVGAKVASAANANEISLSNLNSGNYIMYVETAAGSSVHKIIKK